jgi:Alpha/beta hydrolase family
MAQVGHDGRDGGMRHACCGERHRLLRTPIFHAGSVRPSVGGYEPLTVEVAMREAWELLTAGPPDAERSVLLLPGGANAARSFDLVMADPALSGVRLVATTLPGMAGAPVSEDVSVPALSRRAAELAREHECDVVVGFSHGATVVLEMVLSGQFQGPVVLLGISLTTEDEAAFFRGVVRASQKVGRWPMATMLRLMPLMARTAKTTDQHKKELIEDFKQNRARDAFPACVAYLDYIAEDRDFAAELAASGNPAWVVHAEKGDGGLTPAERATLQAASAVTLVTIPGSVFLLPDEAPQETAAAIAAALGR